jgi:hypothetical protein
VVSSKEVVAPPPPPPANYFRATEWSVNYVNSAKHIRREMKGGVLYIERSNNALTRVATFGQAHRLNRSNMDDEVLGGRGRGS